MNYGSCKVFAIPASRPLAEKICERLSISLGKARVKNFKDGEIDVQIEENVRDHDVYIIADTHGNGENLLQAVHLAEAARASSAGRITFVIPRFGYDRSDRKDAPRKPIGVRIAIKTLEIARPDRFILLDIHAEQSLACIDGGAVHDHLYGSVVAVPVLKEVLGKRSFVVASPDRGGGPRAEKYASLLGQADFVFFSKSREKAGVIKEDSIKILGKVRGKIVVFVDDIIDSGGTIVADARAAKKAGAKEIYVFATHGIFSDGAFERLNASSISQVFVTDSIYHDPAMLAEKCPKVRVLSVAPLLANAIQRTHNGESLTALIP
jgi:ribose-phosphate pyrophosphokinase